MKAALLLVCLFTLALGLGWALDHHQLAVSKKRLTAQLAVKKESEAASAQQISAQMSAQLMKAHSDEQAQEEKLMQELKSKDSLIAKLRNDLQEQNQLTLTVNQDKYQLLQTRYEAVLDNCKYNYEAVAKWNKVAMEKQRELNELWSYTKGFYLNDDAAIKALGDPLYSAAKEPPTLYSITGNGLIWLDTPKSRE
jgi:hypothetical protein